MRLEGEINIVSAAEMKKLLLEALRSGKELRVDIEQATDLDVTARQLLWAASREARGAGTRFTLVGGVPEEISVGASAAGFEDFSVGVNLG